MSSAQLALEGIRVLDWTTGQQGPAATMMLADLGADVIKIESPEGELGRGFIVAKHYLHSGRNFYFETFNRNKRGMVLDLRKDESREILYRLVEKSDVFVQNWRKGVAAKLGADYPTLSRINPKLIYASASAFGSEGPDSDKPGLDLLGQARSGIMLSLGNPDSPPIALPGGLADQMGATVLFGGILVALLARERTGTGQELCSSLLGSMVWLQSLSVMSRLILDPESEQPFDRRDRKNARNALWNWYECADKKWLALSMSRDGKYWHDFCQALGSEGLENDPCYVTSNERQRNNSDLIAILDKVFASKPRAEWLRTFSDYEDLLFAPVNTIPDLIEDPQLTLNQYIVDYEHPVWGKIKEVGFPITCSKTPASLRREAPMLGQHTEEVLIDVLGYTWEDIQKLNRQEVV